MKIELCLCPAASEYDPPCPEHGVMPIGVRGDGLRMPNEYEVDPVTTLYEIFSGTTPTAVDVDTSIAAAESMKPHVGSMRERVMERVRRAGVSGLTCDEAEVSLGLSHQTCSARFRELSKAGVVKDSGTRRPTRSGRKAVVYLSVARPDSAEQRAT